MKRVLRLSLLVLCLLAQAAYSGEITREQRQSRLANARELLGKYYPKSAVIKGEEVENINHEIYRWTRQALPSAYRKNYQSIAQTIIDQSLKYDFDPVFISSMIANESSFDPRQVGSVGEIGLMQLRPNTAKWIAKKYGLRWRGISSLKDPVMNIKLGTAFLAYLRDKFDSHARLYIAAYNMGMTNVKDARERNVWPKDYSNRVMRHYVQYYREIRANKAPHFKMDDKVDSHDNSHENLQGYKLAEYQIEERPCDQD